MLKQMQSDASKMSGTSQKELWMTAQLPPSVACLLLSIYSCLCIFNDVLNITIQHCSFYAA